MPMPERGTKRICQSCGTKFYDLRREHITCPKCHTSYDPEAFLKTRRTRPPTGADKEEAAPALAEGVEIDDVEVIDDDEAAVAAVADEEDEDLIEDASELGEDEDDMAEVIDAVHGDEER